VPFRQFDLTKAIIWVVIVVGVLWALLLVPNGPQYVINGIRFGSILMLGAIGLSLTYKILNFANFSHADILIFGAFIAISADWALFQHLPGWFPALAGQDELVRWLAIFLAMLVGIIAAVLMAYLIDRMIYRRMRRSAAVVLIIASFGMALFIRSLVQALWGTGLQRYAILVRPGTVFDLGFVKFRLGTLEIITILTALVLIVALHLFLKHTRTGKAMRAMSDNTDLARVTGINTERMIVWTWAIGAGLAAIAGVFMGLNFGGLRPDTGALVLLSLFAAVILGGIGNPYGAMLGGLVIGLAQNILVAPAIPSIPTAYQPAIAFILMIIMLLVRPQGLLGEAGRRG
jgi:branched-chain amino acid transport system permease protein